MKYESPQTMMIITKLSKKSPMSSKVSTSASWTFLIKAKCI